MKTLNAIVKVLTALVAAAGAVYVVATYGDQIVDLAERLLAGEDVPTENYANTFVINPDNVAEFIG